jgi:3-deoxy-D-manno-octulosonic-acid transferase
VFVESEVWPNLILAAEAAGTKLALVNARMSPATLARWCSWPSAARRLLKAFSLLLAADARSAEGLTNLSGRLVDDLGNLKLAAPAPEFDAEAHAALSAEIGARPVWVAASTHEGEDELLLAAHAQVRDELPDALLLLAPRHPERGAAAAALAGNAPRRSQGAAIGAGPVYVVDTMGELALFYALAQAAFVAGSLAPRYKGHNPIEPAKLGVALISGPHVESFEDLYAGLRAKDAYSEASAPADIAEAVLMLLRSPDLCAVRVRAAREVVSRGDDALAQTVARLGALAPNIAKTRTADAPA